MKKKEVQKRVLQNGKPLALDKFEWNEQGKIFSSEENDLIIDFSLINGVTFKTDFDCVFKVGVKTKLNGYAVKGYEEIKESEDVEILVDGKKQS